MLHILPMYFEHVVSFRFGIRTTSGPHASLSSVLQAALGHETTVCVTFGARWRNTYFCPCHGYSTITCFVSILGASSLAIRFSMWFGAHSTTAMSGLCDEDSQWWRLMSVDVMVVQFYHTICHHSGRVVPGDLGFNVV